MPPGRPPKKRPEDFPMTIDGIKCGPFLSKEENWTPEASSMLVSMVLIYEKNLKEGVFTKPLNWTALGRLFGREQGFNVKRHFSQYVKEMNKSREGCESYGRTIRGKRGRKIEEEEIAERRAEIRREVEESMRQHLMEVGSDDDTDPVRPWTGVDTDESEDDSLESEPDSDVTDLDSESSLDSMDDYDSDWEKDFDLEPEVEELVAGVTKGQHRQSKSNRDHLEACLLCVANKVQKL